MKPILVTLLKPFSDRYLYVVQKIRLTDRPAERHGGFREVTIVRKDTIFK